MYNHFELKIIPSIFVQLENIQQGIIRNIKKIEYCEGLYKKNNIYYMLNVTTRCYGEVKRFFFDNSDIIVYYAILEDLSKSNKVFLFEILEDNSEYN